jgi:hypothetical protein
MMKLKIALIIMLACIAVVIVGSNARLSSAQTPEMQSKTQPKEVVLGKDSQSDKWGEVAFNHENHATKNYTIDGKAVISCVECHHTDQPPADIKAPLKTSERAVILTTASLAAADAKPVKSCRACHLQAGDDSATIPSVTYADKPAPTKLTNEVAYHTNCNVCHDKAIAARPTLKGKIPGSTECAACHKPVA